MPYYTKTALKKIKKDDLIQMFLDLQAQKVNDCMDEVVEKCCNNAIEEVIEDLKAENEKLKEENSYLENWNIDKLNENYVPLEDYEKLKENLKLSEDKVCELTHENMEYSGIQEENEKLKGSLEELYTLREGEIAHLGQIDLLKHEISKLKEQIDDIKDFLKVCDRNSDGYYEHYETRQIATRVEEGEYKKEEQVKDINGKDVKVPSEAECRALFGVSKEEYIMLAKNSDCNYD